MEAKYGIKPDDTTKRAMGTIEEYIDEIWDEYFEKKMAENLAHRINRKETTS